MSDQLKTCSKCLETKSISEFFKRKTNSDGYDGRCKLCSLVTHKFKYKTNDEYRKRRIQATVNSKCKQWYGINKAEFDALLLLQNSCCAICKVKLDGSRKGLIGHLDHCHTTKKIRGILCKECNMALGLFKDNEKSLLSAVQYLKDSR